MDRLAALTLEAYENGCCAGCGQPINQAWDPQTEREWSVDYPTRCNACTAISDRAKAYENSRHPHALHFGAVHNPRRPRPNA